MPYFTINVDPLHYLHSHMLICIIFVIAVSLLCGKHTSDPLHIHYEKWIIFFVLVDGILLCLKAKSLLFSLPFYSFQSLIYGILTLKLLSWNTFTSLRWNGACIFQLPRMLETDAVARYYGFDKGTVVKVIYDGELTGKRVAYRCVFWGIHVFLWMKVVVSY